MHFTQRALSGLLAGAALASACTLPTTPLSNTVMDNIRVQVQNASYPQVNNLYMNLFVAGGGDQHLFVGPVGNPTYDLHLYNGAIGRGTIRARIGGEDSEIDDTVKMFMTERGDPSALFQPTWACNPETDAVQINLEFIGKQNAAPGGWICVRPAFENSHEFRYYGPGNTKNDPNRFCIKVQLVLVPVAGTLTSTTVTTSTTSSTSSTSSTSTTTTTTPTTLTTSTTSTSTTSTTAPTTTTTSTSTSTTSTSPTGTPPVLPFADMTAQGFRFLGCAPEERRVTPADFPGRTLSGALYAEDAMTNEKCMAFCGSNGWAYAGTEWSRECWCGNSFASTRTPPTTLASLANCNYACSGAAGQKCGGDAWLSLYQKCPVGGPCVNVAFT
ncbi:WSC domain containing protein [Rhypophila decipiens]